MSEQSPTLARQLSTTDAVVVGLGAMLGAGVFSAFGPAAAAAGSGLLVGLGIAAFVAGWGFVIGKTASCAAMALTFGAYAIDGPQWAQRLLGLAAVLVLTAAN